MTDTVRAQLLAAYADEHRDHLGVLRAVLADYAHADFEEAYRHAHSLKGAARAVDLPAVVELAHGLENLLEAWWEGRETPDKDTIRRAAQDVDAIEDLSAAALNVPDAAAPLPSPAPPPGAATRRVEAGTADQLAFSTTRLLMELERQRSDEGMLWPLAAGLDRLAAETVGSRWESAVAGLRDTLHEALRVQEERGWAVARASEALAEDAARLRLVAAEGALGGFGPMVRRLAAEQGKDVIYDAQGLGTLADREVLAVVAEAALHLLRNAVAHGIETPARRRANGKDGRGRVGLAVAVAGRRLEVRVTDDGKGIDTGRLADEAVARGVLTSAQAKRADPDRLRQLVFHPGLSTAEALSTTAGRGMGMPIVRRLVDRLQGSVVVHSAPGRGTEVVISVPLAVMAQKVLLVRARGQTFGLPAPAVVRVLQVGADSLVPMDGELIAVIDGAELPLIDLGALLGLPGASARGADLCIVVIRTVIETMGVVVESVLEMRDLSVIPLDPAVVNDSRLVGTVTLERGALALVLSTAGLRGHGGAVADLPPPLPPAQAPLVLVVDDSNTIRTLERSILEAHGYRVQLAVDGRDGLDRMATIVPDVVVSDIEMPRLDGLGLLAAIRGDPRLARVRVVLVSSRATAEDRQRGMALGADAYIVKSRFDQDELLRIIGRLTA